MTAHRQALPRLWRDAVLAALERIASRSDEKVIARQAIIDEEMDRIVSETQSQGATPSQTLSRVLQDLRNEGIIIFQSKGKYKLVKRIVHVEEAALNTEHVDQAIQDGLLRIGIVDTATEVAEERRRIGQDRVRVLALRNYRNQCAVCDVTELGLLVASHIATWSDAPDARGALSNVLCLCRFHDALFEAGYWSLRDDYSILRKSGLHPETIRKLLPEKNAFRLPSQHLPDSVYLERHRCVHGYNL